MGLRLEASHGVNCEQQGSPRGPVLLVQGADPMTLHAFSNEGSGMSWGEACQEPSPDGRGPFVKSQIKSGFVLATCQSCWGARLVVPVRSVPARLPKRVEMCHHPC